MHDGLSCASDLPSRAFSKNGHSEKIHLQISFEYIEDSILLSEHYSFYPSFLRNHETNGFRNDCRRTGVGLKIIPPKEATVRKPYNHEYGVHTKVAFPPRSSTLADN